MIVLFIQNPLMTPLFTHNEITQISQGQTGDCYLLAVLDCFMNTGPEGLAYIKSLFTETADAVIVRLKQSALSQNLLQKPHPHFIYQVDDALHEDVFVISKARCLEIDASPDGVQSDSLAVKILERICSYYFYNDWQGVSDSLTAHSIRNMTARHEVCPVRSIDFIAQWLSIEVLKIPAMDHLAVIKTILPTLPVYLSMNGQNARHAFRVEAMTNSGCMLVNPWNNLVREHVDFSVISANNPTIYLPKIDTHQYTLAGFLLENFADFSSQFAFNLQTIYQAMNLSKHADVYVANGNKNRIQVTLACLDLLLQQPLIVSLPEQQRNVLKQTVVSLKTKINDLFPKAEGDRRLIRVPGIYKTPSNFVSAPPLQSASECLVSAIQTMPISFAAMQSLDEIERHEQLLVRQLKDFLPKKPTFGSELSVFTIKKPNIAVSQAYDDCLSRIQAMSSEAKSEWMAREAGSSVLSRLSLGGLNV